MKYILALILILAWIDMAISGENCTRSSHNYEVKDTILITTDVPSHLKGAKIIVRRADGVETAVPAEMFKVVARKQQHIISRVHETSLFSCKETLDNKNRISLLGGHGAKAGLDKDVNANTATMKTRTGFVGGAQYQRSLSERISVGVQGQTNKTGSVMIGLDF